MRSQAQVSTLFALSLLLPVSGYAEKEGRSLRSFRPIVPIKQNVSPSQSETHQQTVSVKIPPPPIPAPSSALFPDGSVPEVEFPPEGLVNTGEVEFKEEPDEDSSTPVAIDPDAPTLLELREKAHELANRGLTYKFGADDPDSGGLDCSGAMQYLLTKLGVDDVPRTSYVHYYW